MKNKMIAALLGLLLIGTLGAAVVSAATSDNATANDNTEQKDNFGQMHTLCGKYMSSGNLDSNEIESMHKACGKYMNSDNFKGSGMMGSGMMNTGSGNNADGFSCH